MTLEQTVAEIIAKQLGEHLRRDGADVDRLHVIPRLDGLVIGISDVSGSFQQIQVTAPAWYPAFRENEDQFIRALAAQLPRTLSNVHWDAKGRLDLQYLFVRVLQDLDRTARSHDDYDQLRVAALLRLLLLDSSPLIHQVNRIHRVPMRFAVGQLLINDVVDPSSVALGSGLRIVKIRDGRQFHAVGPAFDPEFYKGDARELEWSEFLSALVLKADDYFVSVRELVEHVAYVEGAIHVGQPKASRPADRAIQKWRRMITFRGETPILQTIAAIGRVVLASQVPLAYECQRALEQGLSLYPDGDK